MKVMLLSCILGLICVSLVRADVLVQPEFDAKQFTGLWYVVSMVSDCKVFLGNKENILMSTRLINATEDGNLTVHMASPGPDGCKTMDVEYLKIGSEGHYKVPANGFLDVRVAETDYKSYCILYIYKELDGVLSTMVQLFSRTQNVSAKALRAFQNFYPIVGLEDDMMYLLSKSGITFTITLAGDHLDCLHILQSSGSQGSCKIFVPRKTLREKPREIFSHQDKI